MLGLEHSKAADVLKDIMNQAVIVVCHPFKDEFAATGLSQCADHSNGSLWYPSPRLSDNTEGHHN